MNYLFFIFIFFKYIIISKPNTIIDFINYFFCKDTTFISLFTIYSIKKY